MDAFELLKADHKKVAGLFDQLEAARGKTKLDIFKQIKNELEVHTHIEETIFYPVLEKPEPTHDLTLEAYEEHKVVKTLLAELSGATTADDEWDAKAKVLRESVEHHVEEEENELFPKADDELSDKQIEDLGARMEAEKARQQGRPASSKTATADKKQPKGVQEAEQPGLLSKIAGFIGIGGKSAAKKSAKTKSSAKKNAKSANRPTNKKAPVSTKTSTGRQTTKSATKRGVTKTANTTSAASSKKAATKTSRKTSGKTSKAPTRKTTGKARKTSARSGTASKRGRK